METESTSNKTTSTPHSHNSKFYRAHAELLKMLVTSAPLPDFFREIALLIEKLSPINAWCAVSLYEGSPPTLHPAANPSIPKEFIEKIEKIHTTPEDGTCGKAITQKKTIIVEDILADPDYKNYHQLSLETGVRASWTVPVFDKNREIIAILTSFFHKKHLPSTEYINQVKDLRDLITLAIQKQNSDQEIRQTDIRFRSVAAATTDAIWDWDLTQNTVSWNGGFAKLFGYEGSKNGPSLDEWLTRIHKDDQNRISQSIHNAIHGGELFWKQEYRFVKTDGNIAHVLDQSNIIHDLQGKAVRMIGGMSDITGYRTAQHNLTIQNRAFEMLSSCNKILIRATQEKQLLNDICHIVTGIGGYLTALVAYADTTSEKQIISAAQFPLDSDSHNQTSQRVYNLGTQALLTGEAALCEDANKTSPETWKQEATPGHINSVICLPLKNQSGCFGYLALSSNKPCSNNKDEQILLQELADNLAFGITSIRDRLKQQLTHKSIVKIAKAVSNQFNQEFYHRLTTDIVNTLGASTGLIGRIDESGDTITTKTYVIDGEIQKNITYNLKGTPCLEVIKKQICLFREKVAAQFPYDTFLAENNIESYTGILLKDNNAKPIGILSILFKEKIRDCELVHSTLQIFAERAASEMLREESESQIRYQASLLNKARDAIFACDLEYNVLFWNESAQRLYGYSQQEIVGKSIRETLHRNTEDHDTFRLGTLREGEWMGELKQTNRAGNTIYVESRWNLLLDAAGKPQSFLIINTDITKHRKIQQQLLKSQQLDSLGSIAGNFAHDLNNVLTPISMSAELLRKTSSTPREKELLEMILNSSTRGAQMISQMLSITHGTEAQKNHITIGKIISELEPIIRDTFPKTIQLQTDVQPHLWQTIGDSTQLHQVILNLSINARDAMPHGGTISISAHNTQISNEFTKYTHDIQPGPHISITLTDSGEGIPPEIINEIFDPFFTTKSTGKGTGLGLSSVRRILKGHSGTILVNSTLGKGTSFTILLPALLPESHKTSTLT